ncbi:hypothetical protein CEXT_106161 [Caerostris extrusa]|uniref:Uncharacterized protein n=1 Tax=Caerostris extrusa TaxID=172846 RepID=A0AAV4WJZ5_CAEEX|nr:hypothetical protein CEXT_106161 [Caerostris extrusa]
MVLQIFRQSDSRYIDNVYLSVLTLGILVSRCAVPFEGFRDVRCNLDRISSSRLIQSAKMLKNHPKLILLGKIDSTRNVHHIFTNSRGHEPSHDCLRKCSWGFLYCRKYCRSSHRGEGVAQGGTGAVRGVYTPGRATVGVKAIPYAQPGGANSLLPSGALDL